MLELSSMSFKLSKIRIVRKLEFQQGTRNYEKEANKTVEMNNTVTEIKS